MRFRALGEECFGALGCRVLKEIMGHAVFDDGVVYTGNWAKQRVMMGYDNASEVAGVEKYGICDGVCKFAGVSLRIHGIQKDEIMLDTTIEPETI
jgi:hypothetical protein